MDALTTNPSILEPTMFYRILTLLIAAAVTWTGTVCIGSGDFGPMFTGFCLMIIGISLFSITVFVWIMDTLYLREHIMNDEDDGRDDYDSY
jgi:hypothetical protein